MKYNGNIEIKKKKKVFRIFMYIYEILKVIKIL